MPTLLAIATELTLGARLGQELTEIDHLLRLPILLGLLALFAIVVLSDRALLGAQHLAWRRGLDRARRLGSVRQGITLGLASLFFLGVVRGLMGVAPIVTAVALLFMGLVLALAAPNVIRDLLAGLWLVPRRTVREGDSIEVEGTAYVVREIGYLGTRVRRSDGAMVRIHNEHLVARTTVLGVAHGSARIRLELDVPVDRVFDEAAASRLLQACPYRRAGTPVNLMQRGHRLEVVLHSWVVRDVQRVERWVRLNLEEILLEADE